jgi:hypothetical protein
MKVVDEVLDGKKEKKFQKAAKESGDDVASVPPPTYRSAAPAASDFSLLRTLKEQIALVLISVIKDKLYDFIDQFGQSKPTKKGNDE